MFLQFEITPVAALPTVGILLCFTPNSNNFVCCLQCFAMHRRKLLHSDSSKHGPASAKQSLFFIRVSEGVGENTCVWQQQQKLQPDSSSLEAECLPLHLRAHTDEPGCFCLKSSKA